MGRRRTRPLDPIGGSNWRVWYSIERWHKRSRAQLRKDPFCAHCAKYGRTTVAEIADHIEPHRGDWNAFWLGALQSLCRRCHDASKRLIDRLGYDPYATGPDGWPLDPAHPANREQR